MKFRPAISTTGSVILPLVALRNDPKYGTNRGAPQKRSGLNWGQRDGRNRNQAIILIPRRIQETSPDFFPNGSAGNRPEFQIITDDGHTMNLVVAQQKNKALQSKPSNDILGIYFRDRLGVPRGAEVTIEHLKRFGSRFVEICSTTDGTYLLNYSPGLENRGSALYKL